MLKAGDIKTTNVKLTNFPRILRLMISGRALAGTQLEPKNTHLLSLNLVLLIMTNKPFGTKMVPLDKNMQITLDMSDCDSSRFFAAMVVDKHFPEVLKDIADIFL